MRGYRIVILVIISCIGLIIALSNSFDLKFDKSLSNSKNSLEILLKGNVDYMNVASYKRQRIETANGQHPIAVVVTCSDSRVSPEILFNQSIGKLFVIRTAGELVDSLEIGSIEYAVEHLDVPLVVVLGHKKCGAVQAYLQHAKAEGGLKKILNMMGEVQESNVLGAGFIDDTEEFIEANARHNTHIIFDHSKLIHEKVTDNKLQLISAIYDIESGKVDILR